MNAFLFRSRHSLGFALLTFAFALPQIVRAQAPSLLWTNSGGRVFAVDEQTNVYAGSGGIVTTLNRDGVPLETNTLSPYPGLAQRDPAGNYYFAGVLPGSPLFDGYNYTNPACALTKYTSTGTLIWSNSFGPTGFLRELVINDLKLDTDGNIYVAFRTSVFTTSHTSSAAKFDASGTNIWLLPMPKDSSPAFRGTIRFGDVSPTNGYVVTYVETTAASFPVTLSQFNSNGTAATIASWYAYQPATGPLVMNPSVEFFETDTSNPIDTAVRLTKRNASGAILRQVSITGHFAAGRDQYGGVHVAYIANQLTRYDSDLNPVWDLTLPAACKELFLDPSGNRFVSLAGGTIGRLSAEIISAPVITNAPQGITVLSGSNAVFTVGASGSTPLRYFWIFNNTAVGTNQTLTLNNVTPSQAGFYSVIVSNFVNTVTSTPALLRVKRVAIYSGNQLLTNGTYTFASPPTLSIRSTFPSGSSFYTLDGSPPTFSSTPYSTPFVLSQSATVRALGYSSDFSQSEEADTVIAVVLQQHSLTASSPGGGSVNLNPPGGVYTETNVVAATAVPAPGWTFLHWQGDASGTNPTVSISMERDKAVQAIFGTSLSTTVAGNGQVVVQPVRTLYPYGEVVRLTGIPEPGNYFGFWGNAATGNTNPLNFSITSSNPVVSSIFAAVPSGQAAFTLMINGRGQVDVNPRANVYPTNQSVTLTTIPDPGRSFAGWTGDASGTQNPLIVIMNQDKVITANFHSAPVLSASRSGLEGMTAAGFRLSVIGDYPYAYQIFASSNLLNWQGLGVITNETGEVQFLDTGVTNRPIRFYRAAPAP
jgi:Chitobiase/beta-hexosaminidase C-terminal domain/Immunoglobulin domain/Divergent InlB B-repeat domain